VTIGIQEILGTIETNDLKEMIKITDIWIVTTTIEWWEEGSQEKWETMISEEMTIEERTPILKWGRWTVILITFRTKTTTWGKMITTADNLFKEMIDLTKEVIFLIEDKWMKWDMTMANMVLQDRSWGMVMIESKIRDRIIRWIWTCKAIIMILTRGKSILF
jgi:hypothetical protein